MIAVGAVQVDLKGGVPYGNRSSAPSPPWMAITKGRIETRACSLTASTKTAMVTNPSMPLTLRDGGQPLPSSLLAWQEDQERSSFFKQEC